MKINKDISVDIEFEADVFPPEAASCLLISTIEYLLFQRRQIPFVFSTFKYMASKWSIQEDNTYESFHLEKQRRLALSTIAEVNELLESIHEESKINRITGARIIFGATPFTPKEIYLIRVPKTSNRHAFHNHKKCIDMTVHKVLMSLLTCEKLYQLFSASIGTTNMYLELETSSLGGGATSNDKFQLKDELEHPTSCSTVHIHLKRKLPEQLNNNCCEDIVIFESIGNLNLDESKKELELLNEDLEKKNRVWKEAKAFVKGFKDIFVKGRSIWED